MNLRLAFPVWMLATPALAVSLEFANDPATGEPGKVAMAEIRREAPSRGRKLGSDAAATRIRGKLGFWLATLNPPGLP